MNPFCSIENTRWKIGLRVLPYLCAGILLAALSASAAPRFPQPDFDTGYTHPQQEYPATEVQAVEYLDIALLFGAIAAASYLALKKRSRRGLLILTVFSIAYFGFWRKGCVCSVGSIQNVAAALFYPFSPVSVTVYLFFILPLVSTLFFGRTFCSSVCPLGAAQDVVALRPVRVSPLVEQVFGLIPYVYLGAAVLLAATGSTFIICRFDPFVSFFRLSGPVLLVSLGAVFLLVGIFIARPYCRFFCPYGVLLGWLSRFSRRHLTITPDECVQCRLCEDSCPFGCIRKPSPESEPEERRTGVRRLGMLIGVLPLLIVAGGWAGGQAAEPLSRIHRTVALVEQIGAEEGGAAPESSLQSDVFRASDKSILMLYSEAEAIRSRFSIGSWILGAFIGLVVGCRLIGLSIRRTRVDYEPDRASCFSCGRCMDYCPVGRKKEQR